MIIHSVHPDKRQRLMILGSSLPCVLVSVMAIKGHKHLLLPCTVSPAPPYTPQPLSLASC